MVWESLVKTQNNLYSEDYENSTSFAKQLINLNQTQQWILLYKIIYLCGNPIYPYKLFQFEEILNIKS